MQEERMKVSEIPLQGQPVQVILVPDAAEAYQVYADERGPFFQYLEAEESVGIARVSIAQVKTGEEVPRVQGYLPCYLGSYFYKYRFHAFWYMKHEPE